MTENDFIIRRVSVVSNKKNIFLCNNLQHNCRLKKLTGWQTSQVVQWLRIRLSMQGTRVQALVCEDPTCRRATRSTHRNY